LHTWAAHSVAASRTATRKSLPPRRAMFALQPTPRNQIGSSDAQWTVYVCANYVEHVMRQQVVLGLTHCKRAAVTDSRTPTCSTHQPVLRVPVTCSHPSRPGSSLSTPLLTATTICWRRRAAGAKRGRSLLAAATVGAGAQR
jgi:hypothetical protein